MNKRIEKKVAKREASHADTGAIDVSSALREVELGATHLAQAIASEVKGRASEAFGQLKQKLAKTEARAEELLEKVPAIGSAAAKKLHEATHP